MWEEVNLFAKALWRGVVLVFIYDNLLILRNVMVHKRWLVSLEDLLYWIGAAFSLFVVFFQENEGRLRGYLFLGVAAGSLAWFYSLHPYYVRYTSFVLKKIVGMIKVPLEKVRIWVKRLKFQSTRCRIHLYEFFCVVFLRFFKKQKNDEGARHEKEKKQKEKKSAE